LDRSHLCSAYGREWLWQASTASRIADPKHANLASDVQQQEPPTLLFDINRSSRSSVSGGSQVYDCTYRARGKTAMFQLVFSYGAMSGDIPMARAEGKFLAVAGSNNSALLEDLMKALEAKQYPAHQKRTAELAFDAVVLGEKQNRSPSGGYSDNPPGDWISAKIFLPKGGDEGEVFLNLNPALGKAEFSIKDSDYGDYVVGQLAKVL
jgi:hypothetical protein